MEKTETPGSNLYLIHPDTWSRIRKPVISSFVLLHLALITIWLFPLHPALVSLIEPFRAYILFIGIDQDFSVFAPKPRSTNLHMCAVIRYRDGTERLWQYPRMERLAFVERMKKERYRKFFNDSLAWSRFKSFLPDVARYVARQNNDRQNPVTSVTLLRYAAEIPGPEEGLGKPLPEHSELSILLHYDLKPGDLNDASR